MTITINAPLTSDKPENDRRSFLKSSLMFSAGVASMGSLGFPRLASAEPLTQRYPDELVEILDESFAKYRLFNASVERLATGMRWAEGPVWVGDGRYLLVSDIPENRIMRWDEITGSFDVFRQPSNHSNGLARDLQGRLLTCEGSTTNDLGRRVTRTEPDGSITVLASEFEGKRFNSPNDLAVRGDGSIWFTDRLSRPATITRATRSRLSCRMPFTVSTVKPAP